jgi:hypothetical protein
MVMMLTLCWTMSTVLAMSWICWIAVTMASMSIAVYHWNIQLLEFSAQSPAVMVMQDCWVLVEEHPELLLLKSVKMETSP